MSIALSKNSTNVREYGLLPTVAAHAKRPVWAGPADLLRRRGLLDRLLHPVTRAERVAEAFLTPTREMTPPMLPEPGGESVSLLVPDFPTPINARAWGRGPTVLLVHGWDSHLYEMGAFIPPLLAAGYRVVAFDQPAHGRSFGELTSVPEMAAALLAVARAAGAETTPLAGVIGHSLGAAALLLALDEGLATRASVLIGTPDDPVRYARDCAAAYRLSPEETRDMLTILDARLPLPISTLSMAAMAAGRRDPALFIHSTDDRVAPVAEALHTAGLWQGTRVSLVDGLGHRRIIANPAVVADTVAFIAAR